MRGEAISWLIEFFSMREKIASVVTLMLRLRLQLRRATYAPSGQREASLSRNDMQTGLG